MDIYEKMYEPGEVVWHSSNDDGGPDVGISVGLGNAMLFVGEVPGEKTAWSLALYPKIGGRLVFGDVADKEVAREAIESLGAAFVRQRYGER